MTPEELQAQKLQLEIDKLVADKAKGEKGETPFYKTGDFWKSIIPTMITTSAVFATLYFTVGRSFIDDEKRKLELQKEQLKLEVMKFENVKLDIQKDIASSTIDKNALLNKIQSLQSQKNKLNGNVSMLKNNISNLSGSVSNLSFEASILKEDNKSLKDAYRKDTSFYRQQLSKRYQSTIFYTKQLNNAKYRLDAKDDIIDSVSAENEYLKNRFKLSQLDKLDMNSAVMKSQIKRNINRANISKKAADDIIKRYEKNSEAAKAASEKSAIEYEREVKNSPESPNLPSLLELLNDRKSTKKVQKAIKRK